MPNKTSAKEWLTKAYHNISSAQILFNADHFTDCIGYDLQQGIEKILKSFLAHDNKQITKTHDLIELSKNVEIYLNFGDNDFRLLVLANSYNVQQRYPSPNKPLPPRDEIKNILEFSFELLELACQKLDIDFNEIKG